MVQPDSLPSWIAARMRAGANPVSQDRLASVVPSYRSARWLTTIPAAYRRPS